MTIQIFHPSIPPIGLGTWERTERGLVPPVPGSRFRAFRFAPGTDRKQRERTYACDSMKVAPRLPQHFRGGQPLLKVQS